jgi:hypothetical protein
MVGGSAPRNVLFRLEVAKDPLPAEGHQRCPEGPPGGLKLVGNGREEERVEVIRPAPRKRINRNSIGDRDAALASARRLLDILENRT